MEKPCAQCGETTKPMFPVKDFFLCQKHSGSLCCNKCFEPYKDLYPEREVVHPGGGHCRWMDCECHKIQRAEYKKYFFYVIEKTEREAQDMISQKKDEGFNYDPAWGDEGKLAYRKLCACDCASPYAKWTAHLSK